MLENKTVEKVYIAKQGKKEYSLFANQDFKAGDVIVQERALWFHRSEMIAPAMLNNLTNICDGVDIWELFFSFHLVSQHNRSNLLKLYDEKQRDIKVNAEKIKYLKELRNDFQFHMMLQNFFTQYEWEEDKPWELVEKVVCVAQCNMTPVLEVESASEVPKTLGRAMCMYLSRCHHSCTPNAEAINIGRNGAHEIRARCNINEGDEITINEIHEIDLSLCKKERMEEIFTSRGFHCSCARCNSDYDDTRRIKCKECTHGCHLIADKEKSVSPCVMCDHVMNPEHARTMIKFEKHLFNMIYKIRKQGLLEETLMNQMLSVTESRLFHSHWYAVQLLRMLKHINPKDYTHKLAQAYEGLIGIPTSRGAWFWEESGDVCEFPEIKKVYYQMAYAHLKTIYGADHIYARTVMQKIEDKVMVLNSPVAVDESPAPKLEEEEVEEEIEYDLVD